MPAQSNDTNIPKIRFPEFIDDWLQNPLGNHARFSKGKGISKNDINENGNTSCIRYGELYTDYGTIIDNVISKTSVNIAELKLSSGGEVIVPASGETAIDIATASVVLHSNIALGGDLNIITSEIDGAFLASYLAGKKRTSLASMAQGNSVVHIYSSQLQLLKIHLPEKDEQQKIASFLGAVDDKIAGLQKKKDLLEAYKKGMMQRLFSQSLRFTDTNGNPFPDWEEKKIEDVYDVVRGYVLAVPKMTSEPVGSSSFPVYSSQTKNNGLTGYYHEYLYEDAITWTTDGANAGDVKYRNGRFYCTNVCGVLISKNGNANKCMAEMLNTVTHKYVSYVGNPKLMNNVMAKIKILFPHTNEQKKIANFLSAIDDKIALVSNELSHAKTFKKGLLQQMFV
jgi:type I restriction enzyme S subunit